jgi:hypothetical protein
MKPPTKVFAPVAEISPKILQTYLLLKANADRWLSNKEIANMTGTSSRTTSYATRNFVALGLIDVYTQLGGYRFRIAPEAGRLSVTAQFEEAAGVFRSSPLAEGQT